MDIDFKEFKREEANLLYEFLSSGIWEFHSGDPKNITKEKILNLAENNYYDGAETKSFWIINQNDEKIGFLKLEDMDDDTPRFDLRILKEYRGNGIGEKSLRWLTDYIFNNYPDIHRVEGCTRHDNLAMRKVFKKCHYLKEGHYRKAWPPPGSTNYKEYYDSIIYGIVRDDWEENKTTLLNWNDEE